MNQTIEYREYPKENREHKSTLFRKVFEEKEHLLDLYNSVNHTDYQNAEDLEVNTLENVVYMTMKNDLSFLIDSSMSLYEHQSTENPNMPLRGLLYFAQLYNKYVAKHNLNLFSSTPQKIPLPQYIVFYNGTQEQPDEQMLYLSDLFEEKQVRESVKGCLECEARMLNINYGKNRELMEKCRRLEEYAIFVARVRKYASEDIEKRESAIERAVNECIEEGILEDILTEQKAEVLELVLTTFNRELYEQGLKEDAAREAAREATREANAEIASLKQQLAKEHQQLIDKDQQLAEERKRVAELEEKIAQMTKE